MKTVRYFFKKSKYIILLLILCWGCSFEEFKEIETLPDPVSVEGRILYYDNFNDRTAINKEISSTTTNEIRGHIVKSLENGNSVLRGNGKGSLLVQNLNVSTFDDFSMSFWFKSFSNDFEQIITQNPVDSLGTNFLRLINSKIHFGASSMNDTEQLPDSVFYNSWQMITITKENINSNNISSGFNIYLNGELYSISTSSLINFQENATIQLFNDYDGDIDKILLYNRFLSSNEIAQFFDIQKTDFVSEKNDIAIANDEGLASYYTFDDMTSKDLISSRNGSNDASLLFSDDTPNSNGFSIKFEGDGSSPMKVDCSLLDNFESTTISFWIKTNRSDYQPILIQGNNTIDGNNLLSTNSSLVIPNPSIYIGESKYCFDCVNRAVPYFDNKWHMLTLTCRDINQSALGGEMKLYFDGIFFGVSDSSNVDFLREKPLIVGSDDGGTVSSLLMDNLRIYNRILLDDEITNIFNEESN